MQNIASLFTQRGIVVALMQCNMIFAIFMPDEYLGIADYYYFPALVCMFVLVPSLGRPIMRSSSINYIIFLLCWQIVVLIVSIISMGDVSSGYALSYILYLLLFFSCFIFEFKKEELKRILNSYLLSGVFVSFLIIYQHRAFFEGGVRFSILLNAKEMFDPNFLAAFLVCPLLIAFYKLIRKFSIFYLISLFVITLGMLMTASRGAMLASFIGIVIGSFDYNRKSKKSNRFWMLILLIMAFAIIAFVIFKFLPENTYERLFTDSYDDSSNAKRLDNWRIGLKAFEKSPLLGYGYNGEMSILRSVVGSNRIAHNTYICFLLQFGIIGCLIILRGIVSIYSYFLKRKFYSPVGILVSTLFVNFFISGEVCFFFWIPLLILSCMMICMKKNPKLVVSDFF